MEVNPSVPAKTVPEFIAYAKANPGKLNMASFGNGNISHVCGEGPRRPTRKHSHGFVHVLPGLAAAGAAENKFL
jgi:Tripartite tricarboxylate transporter family receptor